MMKTEKFEKIINEVIVLLANYDLTHKEGEDVLYAVAKAMKDQKIKVG